MNKEKSKCPKCKNCGTAKRKHSKTGACPSGMAEPGHYVYSDTEKFEENQNNERCYST